MILCFCASSTPIALHLLLLRTCIIHISPGLMVTERNWLDVFTWASWGGNANLPHFVEGQTFLPSELALRQGATQPPPRLSERDLIAAMERYGIGTDATVAGVGALSFNLV
jgi:DNA topoisomerase IA